MYTYEDFFQDFMYMKTVNRKHIVKRNEDLVNIHVHALTETGLIIEDGED